MGRGKGQAQIPIFPLAEVVHFPRTDLRLHIFEPRYRQLVRDLLAREEATRWIGMVLLKPGGREDDEGRPEIFDAGTAGRLIAVDFLPDGRSNIVLRGGFRFEVERELDTRPYRQAIVRPLEEPEVAERDPDLVALRRDLLELTGSLAREMGERFPLDGEALTDLSSAELEEMVNRLAAELDLPPRRKLQLLVEGLPERAANLLRILRARRRVLDLLRPFRHLASAHETN
jgi:Lon protease-like protein